MPILPDACVAVVRAGTGRFALPSGDVPVSEDVRDATLGVLLEGAGFRRQTVHEFARRGAHTYVWCEGDVYRGKRPHAAVALEIDVPEAIVARLRALRQGDLAEVVEHAVASYRTVDVDALHAEHNRWLERVYLEADTAEGGSGFGGTPGEWRAAREPITEGIDHSGTFLDVGCANGLLMESVHRWCGERRTTVEPYGIDIAAGLVARARARLPHWSDRVWVGDAARWVHPAGMRFDYVHLLLDCVPRPRAPELVAHHLSRVVRPGGRLLASAYVASTDHDRSAADALSAMGHEVLGESRPTGRPGTPPTTAWIDAA